MKILDYIGAFVICLFVLQWMIFIATFVFILTWRTSQWTFEIAVRLAEAIP